VPVVLRSIVVGVLLLAQLAPVTVDLGPGSRHHQDPHCRVSLVALDGQPVLAGATSSLACQEMLTCRQLEPALPGSTAGSRWSSPPLLERLAPAEPGLSTAAERPPTPPPNA
jgi:hypothetical protein